MLKPLRIVLVMIEPPLPLGYAASRWYYVLFKGLVERGHCVTTFSICKRPGEAEALRDLFPAPVYDLRLYTRPQGNGLWRKWETFRRPGSYLLSPSLVRDLAAERSQGCDVLHLMDIWGGWLGEGFDPSRVVLSFHSLYDIDLEKKPPRGYKDQLVRALRRRAEHRLLRSYHTLVTLSPRLREAVRAIAPAVPVHIIPLGMDLAGYPFIRIERPRREPVVSLIGSMGWYPSHSAGVRLLTRLWPAIKEQVPAARLQIVGWDAQKALGHLLPLPDVRILENVPDARRYFEQTSVLLYAPERGSGMKVKVLEAFAYGVPVVTTGDGVEGLPAEDGVHAGVADDDAGLIRRTVALLRDAPSQERQRRAARSLVEAHCNPQVTLDAVERCYADVLSRRRKTVT